MFLLLLLIQLFLGTGFACGCSLLLLPINFGSQALIAAYFYTTIYLFGFISLIYNIFCSCFAVLSYMVYFDKINYTALCDFCELLTEDNKNITMIKPYLNKIRTYIIYTNELLYYYLTLVKAYTKDYKYCKYFYDIYDNIYTNIFIFNNDNYDNKDIQIKTNITNEDKKELININNIMNNLSNKERRELENFGKTLFSQKNMQKLVNQFEKSFN